MILTRVMREFGGASGATHRVGELMRLDRHHQLMKVNYVSEVDEDTPKCECGCGRQFQLVEGVSDDNPMMGPEQLLHAHRLLDRCEARGPEGRPARAKREPVTA